MPSSKWLARCATVVVVWGATAAWALIAGKDVNWDQLNYHFYSAYSFLEGRLALDYMPANLQSYFNPLVYTPFYGMVRSGWHSVTITLTLASVHALNILLAYYIMREVSASQAGSIYLATAGALLAALSPIFLLEIGTSFADVSTAVLVLAAVFLLLRREWEAPWWRHCALIAGFLGGAAAGLKLTNAVFAPALAAMLLASPSSRPERVKAFLLLTLGGVAGVVTTHGYWSYLLWREFANPFFPLFNSVFGSPDYPLISHKHERFLPDGIGDLLLYPFRAMSLRSWVHVETVSPDLRYAALCGAGLLGVGMMAFPRTRERIKVDPSLVALTVFFVCAYILWMYASGNGRYGVVVSLLVGPLLVAWAAVIFRSTKRSVLFLGIVTLAQIVHLQHGQFRWAEGRWTRTWYDEKIPSELATTPSLYLSLGTLSNSFIAPYLASQSAFVNPIGQMSFGVEGPGSSRIKNLLERYEGKVRMLSLAPARGDGGMPTESWTNSVNALLSRFNLRVNTDRCHIIETDGPPYELGMDFSKEDDLPRRLISCELVPALASDALVAERRRVEATLSEVVKWCPKMFKPAYAVVERKEDGWFANFSDSDTVLRVEGGSILLSQTRSLAEVFLGDIDDWESGKRPDNCTSLPRQLRKHHGVS